MWGASWCSENGPGAVGFPPLLLWGGTAFAAGVTQAVSAEEGVGFLLLPCWGAAVAGLKVAAGAGSPCRDGFSLTLYPSEGLISVKGQKAHPTGSPWADPPAAAEISVCVAVPTGFKEHHSNTFNVHEKRHILNSWPHLAPSPLLLLSFIPGVHTKPCGQHGKSCPPDTTRGWARKEGARYPHDWPGPALVLQAWRS